MPRHWFDSPDLWIWKIKYMNRIKPQRVAYGFDRVLPEQHKKNQNFRLNRVGLAGNLDPCSPLDLGGPSLN